MAIKVELKTFVIVDSFLYNCIAVTLTKICEANYNRYLQSTHFVKFKS